MHHMFTNNKEATVANQLLLLFRIQWIQIFILMLMGGQHHELLKHQQLLMEKNFHLTIVAQKVQTIS